MNKRAVFTEAFLIIFIFQSILNLINNIIYNLITINIFNKKITIMIIMIFLTLIFRLYVYYKKTSLSFLPQKFSKFYIIFTIIYAIVIIFAPSNFSGGYRAILVLIYGSIVTPVYEELIFRGYLWNRLNKVFSKELYTFIWSVILFSLWHIGYMIPQIVKGNWFAVITKLLVAFFYGVILGLVRLKGKNCFITTLLHGLLNTISI